MPKQPINTIRAPINVQPVHLIRLARVCDWTIATTPTAIPHTFTLSPRRIGQLAAGGTTVAEILETITAALGRQPSRRVIQRVRNWVKPGQQVRIRPLVVLEADSADRLAQLRRHKLVRNRLGAVIAPNRIALNPDDAQALAQTLRTLGYFVEPPAPASSSPGREGNDVDGNDGKVGLSATLQWLLVTLYQGLGAHVALPVALPWDVREELRGQLTHTQQASAEAAAATLLDHVQAALNGYLQIPAWTMPATEDPVPVIREALDQGRDVELRYWGPSDGHVTTRVVTPPIGSKSATPSTTSSAGATCVNKNAPFGWTGLKQCGQ